MYLPELRARSYEYVRHFSVFKNVIAAASKRRFEIDLLTSKITELDPENEDILIEELFYHPEVEGPISLPNLRAITNGYVVFSLESNLELLTRLFVPSLRRITLVGDGVVNLLPHLDTIEDIRVLSWAYSRGKQCIYSNVPNLT